MKEESRGEIVIYQSIPIIRKFRIVQLLQKLQRLEILQRSKVLNRVSERIPRRLLRGLASELQ
jgi:hypothetical protein